MDRPAMLSDLERFATKADLERFATKADLERFATKADLEDSIKRLATATLQQFGRVDARIDRLERVMREGFSELKRIVEDSMGQFGKLDRRQIITDYRIDELEKRVKKVERPS